MDRLTRDLMEAELAVGPSGIDLASLRENLGKIPEGNKDLASSNLRYRYERVIERLEASS